MEFTITSPAFTHGGAIPARFTADGPDVSPALTWTDPPEGTRSLALICDDPDAPVGTWVHWVLYDMPPDVRSLDENMPRDEVVLGSARHGRNDFGRSGYGGPAPPPGKAHRYFFKLYAVDTTTDLGPGARKEQVLKVIDGRVLGQAELMGTYER